MVLGLLISFALAGGLVYVGAGLFGALGPEKQQEFNQLFQDLVKWLSSNDDVAGLTATGESKGKKMTKAEKLAVKAAKQRAKAKASKETRRDDKGSDSEREDNSVNFGDSAIEMPDDSDWIDVAKPPKPKKVESVLPGSAPIGTPLQPPEHDEDDDAFEGGFQKISRKTGGGGSELTRKQRQNQKKKEKLKAEKEALAKMQEERLRQHRMARHSTNWSRPAQL